MIVFQILRSLCVYGNVSYPRKYYIIYGIIDHLTEMVMAKCQRQSHTILVAMLSSPIIPRASTSELFVALPDCSHACNMAALQFSASPPLSLSMSSRREQSIFNSKPSPCQFVRSCRLLLMMCRWEVSVKEGTRQRACHVHIPEHMYSVSGQLSRTFCTYLSILV